MFPSDLKLKSFLFHLHLIPLFLGLVAPHHNGDNLRFTMAMWLGNAMRGLDHLVIVFVWPEVEAVT